MSERRSRSSQSRPARRIRETAPFVAREAELEWLEGCLQEVIDGAPRVCFVSGDAGIGKSRLVRELAASARRADMRVCYGRGHEDFQVSYAPFESLIDELATSAGEDARTRESVDTLCALLGRGDADPADTESAPDAASAEAERRRTFQSIARGIFRHTRPAPLVMVLEDLHWFDSRSLDLLGHIAFSAADTSVAEAVPLMLICTYRPPEANTALSQFEARFRREDICETLELQGFESDELDQLLQGLRGGSLGHHIVSKIMEVTGGNPLFVEEVFHQLSERGLLDSDASSWSTSVGESELELPAVLSDAIAARVGKLSAHCRAALTLAAFMPEPILAEDVAAAGEFARGDVDAWLDEATDAGVLTNREGRMRIAHPLIGQALRQLPAPSERRTIHRRLAQWLEERHAQNLDPFLQSIADHWVRGREAGDAEHVIEVARRAGDQAFRVFDWPGATHHYEATLAVANAEGLRSAQERAQLHYSAGTAQFREMDADAALAHFARAVALFEECGDVPGAARALLDQARTRLTLRSNAYGTLIDVEKLEGSLAALGDSHPALRGYVCATLAEAYAMSKAIERAAEYGRRAGALADESKDERLAAYSSVSLGVCHQQGLQIEQALACFDAALERSRRSGETWTEGWALQRMPLALAWLGRLDTALARTGDAAKIAQQINDWGDYSLALGAQTALAAARGDFASAEAHARETMNLARRTGYPWGGVIAVTALAGARGLQGEWTDADDALAIVAQPGVLFEEVGADIEFLGGIGRMRLRAIAGTVDEATLTQARNLLPFVRESGIDIGTLGAFCAFVEIGQAAGDPSLAEQSFELLETAAERGVVFSAGCEFLLPRILGVAALQMGRETQAETYLRDAIALSQRVGARPSLARSCVDLADLLCRRDAGGRSEAARLLDRADDIFFDRGMRPLLANSLRVRETHDLPLSSLSGLEPNADDELTLKEREVLRAMTRALDDAAIGENLLLLPATVRQARRSIFDKIGVEGRTGATAYSYAHGGAEGSRGYLPRPHRGDAGRRILWVSDIVGSTQLLEDLGDARAHELFRLHNRIVRARLRAHRGEEVQHTGDGLIAAFPSSEPAVHCAIAVQREIAEYSRNQPETAFSVRIGIHAGRPLADEGRLFGVAVHTTFRVCDQGGGGDVLISQEIVDSSRDAELAYQDLGPATLRGIAEPLRLYRVTWENTFS